MAEAEAEAAAAWWEAAENGDPQEQEHEPPAEVEEEDEGSSYVPFQPEKGPQRALQVDKHRGGTSSESSYVPLHPRQETRLAAGVEVRASWDSHSTVGIVTGCLLYTSPSPRDGLLSRMPSSA